VALQKQPVLPAPSNARDRSPPAVVRHPFLASSVGKKMLIALTGLCLVGFLIFHLIGNLLLFFGPASLNEFSNWLIVNPLLVPAEIGLLALFLVHVVEAVTNWLVNRQARPIQYSHPVRRLLGYGWAGRPSRKGIASTTMIVTGLVIVVFLIVHLLQFKFGPEYRVASPEFGTPGIRDLYRLDVETFSNGLIVTFYVLCLVLIGFHLWHGIGSAFNSLGIDHPRYTPSLLRLTRLVALIIAAGFITIPLWVYFFRG
jgi:succinate dehydrogenase / fumarate reductase cytochrome b subunit